MFKTNPTSSKSNLGGGQSAVYLEDVVVVVWNGIQHFYSVYLVLASSGWYSFPGWTKNCALLLGVDVSVNVNIPVIDCWPVQSVYISFHPVHAGIGWPWKEHGYFKISERKCMDVQARIETDVCLYFCLVVCCTLHCQ